MTNSLKISINLKTKELNTMLKLTIVSPEKTVYDGDAESVLVPGTLGQFEILTDHAPIISTLEEGEMTFKTQEGTQTVAIAGGFISVKHNEVKVCVEI